MRVIKSGETAKIVLDENELCEYGVYLMYGENRCELMTSLLRAACPELLGGMSAVSAEFKAVGDGCEILLSFEKSLRVHPRKRRPSAVYTFVDGARLLDFAKTLCLMNAADGCRLYADGEKFYLLCDSPSFGLRHIAKEFLLRPERSCGNAPKFSNARKLSGNIAKDMGEFFEKQPENGV